MDLDKVSEISRHNFVHHKLEPQEVLAWDGPGSGLAAAVRVSSIENGAKFVDSFSSLSRSSSAMRSPWILVYAAYSPAWLIMHSFLTVGLFSV